MYILIINESALNKKNIVFDEALERTATQNLFFENVITSQKKNAIVRSNTFSKSSKRAGVFILIKL